MNRLLPSNTNSKHSQSKLSGIVKSLIAKRNAQDSDDATSQQVLLEPLTQSTRAVFQVCCFRILTLFQVGYFSCGLNLQNVKVEITLSKRFAIVALSMQSNSMCRGTIANRQKRAILDTKWA